MNAAAHAFALVLDLNTRLPRREVAGQNVR
jgi:hypothetical protein